jgi:hypothetical protein
MASKVEGTRAFFYVAMSKMISKCKEYPMLVLKLNELQSKADKIFETRCRVDKLEKKVCEQIMSAVECIAEKEEIPRGIILQKIARKIFDDRPDLKSDILAPTVIYLRDEGWLDEAFETAQEIPDENTRDTVLVNLIERYKLEENELEINSLNSVMEIIEQIHSPEMKSEEILQIIRLIANDSDNEEFLDIAEDAISKIPMDNYRDEACHIMAECLKESNFQKAVEYADVITNHKKKINTLSSLLKSVDEEDDIKLILDCISGDIGNEAIKNILNATLGKKIDTIISIMQLMSKPNYNFDIDVLIENFAKVLCTLINNEKIHKFKTIEPILEFLEECKEDYPNEVQTAIRQINKCIKDNNLSKK